MNPSIEPLGDSAALIAWRSLDHSAAWVSVQNAAACLDRNRIDGIVATAPAFKSLTVYYDCRILTWTDIAKWIEEKLSSPSQPFQRPRREIDIPVCYDEEFALDLISIAAIHDLSPDEVIQLHSNAAYVVQMIGFSPGFPYLAGLPVQLHTPRRAAPRLQVPSGSVAIGGEQAGIYSCSTPGGWNIVGRTPVRLFDPQRNPPCLLQTGDTLRFVKMDRRQFDDYTEQS